VVIGREVLVPNHRDRGPSLEYGDQMTIGVKSGRANRSAVH
jgi:hypothetical protein